MNIWLLVALILAVVIIIALVLSRFKFFRRVITPAPSATLSEEELLKKGITDEKADGFKLESALKPEPTDVAELINGLRVSRLQGQYLGQQVKNQETAKKVVEAAEATAKANEALRKKLGY